MPVSVAFIKELENLEPKLRHVLLSMLEELERQREESVTKKEFNELKEIVSNMGKSIIELTEAQKRTEARVEELAEAQKRTEARVEELAGAQKRTEARLESLAARVEELAEAQKRTEARLESLAARVEELAEAQKRTEARVEELAEAQKRTETRLESLAARVEELSEAQKRTEHEIEKLTKRIATVEERLEGISNSIGYTLENSSYKTLPHLLLERYNIKIEGKLRRQYISINHKNIQVNIYGHATKEDKHILILGECKVRPSKKEIERFHKYAKLIEEKENTNTFLLFVAHDFPPEIEKLLKEKGIAYFWSYEL